MRAKETQMANLANAVVVLSEVQKLDLIDRGIPEEKIWVIPNAAEPSLLDRPHRSSREARVALGLPEDGFWVGSASAIVGYEGFDILLEAIAHLRRQGRDIRCLVVGDGVSRPGLLAQARELKLKDDVCILPGRVAPDTVTNWYEALDVCVVPRRDTPVCRIITPLKPLTALALGIPVVASDLPALREVTRGTGRLFTPQDPIALSKALAEMMDTFDANRRRTTAAHEIPTWDSNGHTYAELYGSL